MSKLLEALLAVSNGKVTVGKFEEGFETTARVSNESKNLIKEFKNNLDKYIAEVQQGKKAKLVTNDKFVDKSLELEKGSGKWMLLITFETPVGNITNKYYFNLLRQEVLLGKEQGINMVDKLSKYIGRYDINYKNIHSDVSWFEYLSNTDIEFPITYGMNKNNYFEWMLTTADGYKAYKARLATKVAEDQDQE